MFKSKLEALFVAVLMLSIPFISIAAAKIITPTQAEVVVSGKR